MAEEGLKLTSFYIQPVCGRSRAALLTGCYPIHVGEPGNKKNIHTILHPEEISLPEVLKETGYARGIVGKWHPAGRGEVLRRSGNYCQMFSVLTNGEARLFTMGRQVSFLKVGDTSN